MPQVSCMYCCGWAELHGVQKYTHADFHVFLKIVRSYSKGAFVFSSATRAANPRTCGSIKFAKDLEKHNLGVVTKLPPFRNPNTGRNIIGFQWAVDRDALDTYCVKNNLKNLHGF
jgi:hypothetical protein